jgi:hypothetical protein
MWSVTLIPHFRMHKNRVQMKRLMICQMVERLLLEVKDSSVQKLYSNLSQLDTNLMESKNTVLMLSCAVKLSKGRICSRT